MFEGKVEALKKRVSRKRSAEEAFTQRKSRSDEQKAAAQKTTNDIDFSSSDVATNSSRCFEDVPESSTSRISVKPLFVTLEGPRKIAFTPQVVAAADRHKHSSNALNNIVRSVIKDSGDDVNDFVRSISTTLRTRKTAHNQQFQNIKSHFASTSKGQFFQHTGTKNC